MPDKPSQSAARRRYLEKKKECPEWLQKHNDRNKKSREKHNYGVKGTRRRWTEEERDLIMSWEGDDGLLAKKINRSLSAVYTQRALLVAQGYEMIERPHRNGKELLEGGALEVMVYMSEKQYDFAKKMGYGNISKGVRMAVDREMRKAKKDDL